MHAPEINANINICTMRVMLDPSMAATPAVSSDISSGKNSIHARMTRSPCLNVSASSPL